MRRGWVAAATASLLVWCSPACGHQDTILHVSKGGEIEGLPQEYRPAYLKVVAEAPSQDPRVVLRLGNHVVDFPACISVLFHLPKGQRMRVSASWYHDPESLPFYLVIQLPQRRSEWGPISGWSVLIDLKTAELLEVKSLSIVDSGRGQDGNVVEIGSICSTEEMKELIPRAVE